jgi:hypothetical protein
MKSRWALVCAVLVAVGVAWAAAETPGTQESSAASATITAATAQVDLATDPYLGASTLSTSAPAERKPCSLYANDCVYEGGPCGPVPGACHCQHRPTGWICG